MRKYLRLTIFLVLAVILVGVGGCFKNQVAVTVGLGENFTIGIGKSARITGEDMVITFDEVIGDSRCPQNVTCVWAGVASMRVTIIRQNVNYSMALNESGLAEQSQADFIDYTLTYSLNPYPIAGKEISSKEYRLTMTVTK